MAWLSAATALLVLTGCSKEISKVNETVQTEITGSRAFFGSISCITDICTKGGEVPLEETVQAISPLMASAKEYLKANGYDYLEDFAENDPNIILTAYALMEYDFTNSSPQTKISFTNALSCIFLGESVDKAAGTGAMLIAKRYAKKLLIRAIPYAGTVAGVVTTGYCLYENW